MKLKSILLLSFATLLLVANTGAAFAATATPTGVTVAEPSVTTSTETKAEPSASIQYTSYAPRPGDEKLVRGPVTINYEKSYIYESNSKPTQVYVVLQGFLPTPCHQLRVAFAPIEQPNVVSLNAYSLTDPNTACITVIQPFTATIYIGNYFEGTYTVVVNGVVLGKFDV